MNAAAIHGFYLRKQRGGLVSAAFGFAAVFHSILQN